MGLQPVAISPLGVYRSVPRQVRSAKAPRQVFLLWLWCQGHPRSGWGRPARQVPGQYHLLESKSLGTRDQGIL